MTQKLILKWRAVFTRGSVAWSGWRPEIIETKYGTTSWIIRDCYLPVTSFTDPNTMCWFPTKKPSSKNCCKCVGRRTPSCFFTYLNCHLLNFCSLGSTMTQLRPNFVANSKDRSPRPPATSRITPSLKITDAYLLFTSLIKGNVDSSSTQYW